jgi:hypothetical protein
MFSPQAGPVGASAPSQCGHQAEPAPPIAHLQHGKTLTAVDLRSLPPGTELVVETRNSRYCLAMLDEGWDARVQGGRHFEETTTARIDGCTFGGSLMKLGWIAVGCCLELSVRGRRIVTSRVRSISVNIVRPQLDGHLRRLLRG